MAFVFCRCLKGFSFPLYVVELTIHPPSSIPIPVPGPAPMLKPIFSDEKGRCFVRRAASVCQVKPHIMFLASFKPTLPSSDSLPAGSGNDNCGNHSVLYRPQEKVQIKQFLVCGQCIL